MYTKDLYVTTFGLTPKVNMKNDTAFVVLPSHQRWRLTKPVWEDFSRKLWVAGPFNDPPYSQDEVRELIGIRGTQPQTLLYQGYADHTPMQMGWVADQLQQDTGVKQVILSTAAYHLPRCCLTFAKTWLERNDERTFHFACYPSISTNVLDGFAANETFLGQDEMKSSVTVESELERIEKYQEAGDVATAEEFAEFLNTIRP